MSLQRIYMCFAKFFKIVGLTGCLDFFMTTSQSLHFNVDLLRYGSPLPTRHALYCCLFLLLISSSPSSPSKKIAYFIPSPSKDPLQLALTFTNP